ncbi:hypothetical protein [Haloimpatiens massiliensis]|uniref:hypothetical protein n=1 Tax=Haloimpatiens massiliensis TaxID=1658110 RepID=UPI000C83CFEE|nr:hypothetical protein [Haloimpatiens massiliensis]
MEYSCENHIQNSYGERFFIGDKVSVYKESSWCFRGKITHITSKGIYLDVGAKADKYFRANEIDEIKILGDEK